MHNFFTEELKLAILNIYKMYIFAGNSQPHTNWSSLESSIFVDASLSSLCKSDDSVTCNLSEKVTFLLQSLTVSKMILEVTLPHNYAPQLDVNSFAFTFYNIKRLLDNMDSYGNADPWGFIPLV